MLPHLIFAVIQLTLRTSYHETVFHKSKTTIDWWLGLVSKRQTLMTWMMMNEAMSRT